MGSAIEWSEVADEVGGQVRRQAPKLLALAIATELELALRRRLRRQGPKLMALAIGTGVYILQIVFSAYWLQRHLYGPVEWLWRSAMYGTRQPLWRR